MKPAQFFSLSLFATSALFASNPVIDFNEFDRPVCSCTIPHRTSPLRFKEYAPRRTAIPALAFNEAPEFAPFFRFLKKQYNLEEAVETGTFQGHTAAQLAQQFDRVHTIEIVEKTFKHATRRLSRYGNVECLHGDSKLVFKDLLPTLENKRVLFYLDAHWQNEWPLLGELEEISKTHKDNCVIVIDDFKVPGFEQIGYDIYGEHECSLEYIQEKLAKVFTEYEYYFIVPKKPESHGKFVAFPKSWGKDELEDKWIR